MKRLLPTFLTALLLGASTTRAGESDDMNAAHRRGDYAEAAKGYRLAAERGNAAGQGGLGLMYAAGEGVAQDHVRAYLWFDLAALSGYKMAVANVGIFEKRMTPQQVAEANKLARDCRQRNFKGCD